MTCGVNGPPSLITSNCWVGPSAASSRCTLAPSLRKRSSSAVLNSSSSWWSVPSMCRNAQAMTLLRWWILTAGVCTRHPTGNPNDRHRSEPPSRRRERAPPASSEGPVGGPRHLSTAARRGTCHTERSGVTRSGRAPRRDGNLVKRGPSDVLSRPAVIGGAALRQVIPATGLQACEAPAASLGAHTVIATFPRTCPDARWRIASGTRSSG